ncbi:DUF6602 domain-containing protein [Arthrobacter sp. H20]|uniref:DUF6602 domain-containing protein n=1 Tax=Arthrobacter sp. H20 TaxID=1267981 RepID=UPI00047DDE3F|nr:DUF6602 domain-containing protein [Arthrobacter sp. H20]
MRTKHVSLRQNDQVDTNRAGLLLRQMDDVAKQMVLDFETSSKIQHNASKGSVREGDLVRDFLAKYVSRSATVMGSGELVSTDGQISNQCDVMLVDNDTPPFYKSEHYAMVPIECCYATVEVKSNLTTDELKKAWAAAKKAKAMPRAAFTQRHPISGVTQTVHGQTWEHASPLRAIVYGYRGAKLESLAREMSLLAAQDPDPASGLDSVFVADQGFVTWQQLTNGAFFERQAESVVAAVPAQRGNTLLLMMTVLNEIVAAAQMNDRVDLKRYVTESFGQVASWWDAGNELPMKSHSNP